MTSAKWQTRNLQAFVSLFPHADIKKSTKKLDEVMSMSYGINSQRSTATKQTPNQEKPHPNRKCCGIFACSSLTLCLWWRGLALEEVTVPSPLSWTGRNRADLICNVLSYLGASWLTSSCFAQGREKWWVLLREATGEIQTCRCLTQGTSGKDTQYTIKGPKENLRWDSLCN